jgi:superfamily II DNA or RNA helicase
MTDVLLEEAALDRGEVIILLRDEVVCNITGLTPFHRNALEDLWALRVRNAHFIPSVKTGAWDGKIKFFQMTGNTYIRLLPEIVPWIIESGYKIRVIDKRPLPGDKPQPINDQLFAEHGVVLRYYQVEAVNAAIQSGDGLLLLGTGAGKTFIAAAISQVFEPRRSIIIVPNTNLVYQTGRDYEKCGIIDWGPFCGKKKVTDRQHMIATWQSLQNNPKLLTEFGVVITDEAHGTKAKVLRDLLTIGHGATIPYRFGMTGTLPEGRCEKVSLRSALGDVIYEKTSAELIDEEYLSRLDILVLQIQDTDHYDFPAKIEWDTEKRFLTHNKPRLGKIAEIIGAAAESGNTFVLVNSIAAGKTLEGLLEDSVFLYGATDSDDRAEEYESFDKLDNKIIIATYGIAQVGISIDRIFNLVLVDGGRAFVRAIQSIGRGLRMAADKHEVRVLDLCSNGKYSRKHMDERCNYYRRAHYPYRVEQIDLEESS